MNTDGSGKLLQTDSRVMAVIQKASSLVMPPPKRAAWKWAEDKRELPRGSAEPGPFNARRAPWVVGITEATSCPRYSEVCAVMGSQMSKTDGVLINAIGWQLDDDPQPMLYIGPTQKNTETISNDRVTKMIRGVPTLWDGLAKGKKNKVAEKIINGVRLGFGWAGSATELASHPAAKVFIDERDRMGGDVEGEGDVNTLAGARVATYDGTVITVSTPLIGHVETETNERSGLEHWKESDDLASPTWALWQEGSRHEWAWPCPDCKEYYIPRFKLLWWPEGATANEAFKAAAMTCPHCGGQHGEEHKEKMNARGIFIAPGQKPHKSTSKKHATITNDDDKKEVIEFGSYAPLSDEGGSISFWVSGLCSPWRSFGVRARTFLRAVKSGEDGRIQAAINTGFGELYRVTGDAPPWEEVLTCEADYQENDLPDYVTTITAGVDVQKDRLVYAIRGWGNAYTSGLITRGELWGETDHDHVWTQLDELITRKWGDIPISRMAVDSGYRSSQVYEFCRKHPGRAIATKGHDHQDKEYRASTIDVNIRGKVIKNGLQLWHFDADVFKSFVHGRLNWEAGKPGAWYLFSGINQDYCKQIVAETRVTKPSGRAVWVKIAKDNHFLDCEALNYLAIRILGGPMKKPVKGKKKKQRTNVDNSFLGTDR